MSYTGPEYWNVIYRLRALGDFSDLIKKAAEAKAALDALKTSAAAEGAAEAKAATEAAAAHKADVASINEERRALEQLAAASKLAQVWTAWGGRTSPEAHMSDLDRELNLKTLINRQEWLGFTTPQQAYAWRTNELNQRKQMNYAEWAGYQTADQYLSYLQKQRSGLADLNTELLARAAAYRSVTDAALSYADASRGTHASLGQLSEGLDLSGVSQFQQALIGLPDVVSTKLTVDDAGAMAQLAQYQALLRGIPHEQTTRVSDVITAAYAMGGTPIPSALPHEERIPVSFTGPWQDQFAAILADVAALKAEHAEIPVDFHIDPTEVAALKAKLGQVNVTELVTQHLVSQGGGIGGGGGPPPVAPGPAAEPPDDAAAKWAALTAAMAHAGDEATYFGMGEKAAAAATDFVASRAAAAVPKLDLASTSFRVAGSAIGFFQQHFSLFAGALGSTAFIGTVTGFHIALDAIVEVLALLVPALVTATAGLLGWGAAAAQAGQQVYNQMKNVLTVSSALNTVVAPLKGNFQALQDAVRPQVYQLLGDALDLLNGKTGVFQTLIMKTGQALDEFGARVVVDMQRGQGGLAKFFDTGEKVLKGLGQLLIPLGAIFSNLIKATEKTHIAEDLLAIADALAKLAVIVTSIPTPLLALVLGLHGLSLWGGLAVTALSKLGISLVSAAGTAGPLNGIMTALAAKLGATDAELVKMATHAPAVKAVADAMGANASSIAQFSVAADKSGKSVEELAASTAAGSALFAKYGAGLESAGQDAVNLAIAAGATEGQIARLSSGFASASTEVGFFGSLLAKLGGWSAIATGGLVALAAAAGFFAYKSLTARDASQQWIDSINKGLASQSLFTVIGKNISDLAAVTDQLSRSQGLNAQATHELSGAQTELSTNLALALPRVGSVSKAYGTDMVGALELLNLAGVKTSDLFTRQGIVWATDEQMVKGLVDGYKAMGQQLGTVGSDLNVLLVSESDQLKSMGNLNKAWDAFQKLVSAPTDTILSLASGLRTFATDAKAAGASMLGLSPPAVKLQQDFQTTYGNVQQLFDAFRNAQAVDGGVGSFTKFVKDAVAALVPLAGNNKAAAAEISQLAQEAGGPATTNLAQLAHWAGNVKDPMLALYHATQQQTVASSNLSADAAKLSNTLQSELDPAMAKAAFDAEGGQKALSAFADDLLKLGPGSQATVAAGRQVADMFLSIDKNSGQAKAQFVGWVTSMGYSKARANQLWDEVSKGARPLADMRSGLAQSATASDNLSKSGFFASRGDVFRTNMREMATWFGTTLPHAFETAGKAVASGLGGPLTSFFTKTVPAEAGTVGAFFTGPFRTSVEGAWSHVWSALVSPVVQWTDDVKHAISSGFDSWWKTHGTAVEQIWGSVTGNLAMAWDNFTGGLKRAWTDFTGWFHGAGDTTKFLTGSWDKFYAEGVKPVLGAIETGWRITFGALEAIAKIAFDLVAATLKTAWDAAMAVVKTTWDAAMAVLKIAWDTVVALISVTIDLVTGHWKTAWTDVTNWFKQVMNVIWDFLKQGFNNFDGFFRQLWNNSLSFLRQSWNAWWGWFDNNIIHSGFGHFLTSTLPGWFTYVYDFFVSSWKKSWAQFNSIFIQPADHLFNSTFPGWLDNVGRFFSSLWQRVWGDFSRDIISPMDRWFSSSLPNAIQNGFRDSINWVIDNVINKVINFINNDILKHLPGSLHISTIGNVASGGGLERFPRMAAGSVPGPSAVDGTPIMAMGGEYMLRQPARMALEQAYGRGFMDHLNQADSWLGSGSRGTPASQARQAGVNTGPAKTLPFPAYHYATGGQIVAEAERFIGAPYVYGGTSPSGWDCSGFVQYVLEQLGWHNVPRTSEQQYAWTSHTSNPSIGGLVFAQFPGDNAPPGHVGFYVGNGNVLSARDPQWGTGIDTLSSWGGHIVGFGSEPNATGLIGQILSGLGSFITEPWQAVEGLLSSAGNALGDLVKPLASMVSGGAGELLKLAKEGAAAIFNGVWDHTVKPLVDLMPGDSIPGALSQGMTAEVRQAIDNFMTGQDSSAKSSAAAANAAAGSAGAIGPVSGPADAGPGQAMNYAMGQMAAHGWPSSQFSPLKSLWTRESGWNRFARNPSSGAYGIPQALPPTKLPPAGQAGGGSHASPQIDWGLGYIHEVYGDPSGAWNHEVNAGWYPFGGVVGGDGASLMAAAGQVPPPLFAPALASGGLTGWAPLNTAIYAEMSAMEAIQRAHLPPGPTPTMDQRHAFTAWQEALWGQQLKTVGLGRTPPGAYAALAAHAASPASQTAGQWQALTGDLSYLTKESAGTGAGGINPPGTPANSGWAAWRYLRPQWQALLDRLRIASSRAATAQTQWGNAYSTVPLGPGSAGQTNTDSPEWDSASQAMLTAVRTEMDAMAAIQAAHLPSGPVPSMSQRYDYTSWQEALWKQQLKTVGLGRTPPGAFQAISDRLSAPGTISAGQWTAFLGDMAYLQREEEGPGAGGINPPGSRPNSGWPAWKYLHGDWQNLLNAMRNAQAKTKAAEGVWSRLYGPGHLPSTPGPGRPPHATPVPSGLINVMPEATLGGPAHPVLDVRLPGGADMGFAAGGGLGQVSSMFSGGLNPGGVMLPVIVQHGIPDSVLRQLSGAGMSGQREYPRRLSEAGGAHYGPALNVETLTINNPQPAAAEDSITRASNRLSFLAGRGIA